MVHCLPHQGLFLCEEWGTMPADTVFTEDSFNMIQQIRDAGLVGYEDGVTKCAEVAALRQTKFSPLRMKMKTLG